MQKKRRTSSSYVIVSPRRSKKEKNKLVGRWVFENEERKSQSNQEEKKQECVFSIIGKYRLLFWGNSSFVVNILIFYSLVVSISNLLSFASSEVATDDLLALSLSISPRSNGGYLPPSIYISPFLSIVVVPSSLPTDKIHLLKNPQNNNKNNNNEYTIKKRTERECCSATSDISVKLKENKSYYQKKENITKKVNVSKITKETTKTIESARRVCIRLL